MTAGCHRFEHARYCEALGAEFDRLVVSAGEADPAAAVTSCPDWTVRDLLQHVGGVHRWAAHHVRTLAPQRVPFSAIGLELPEDGFAGWLAEGGAGLLAALREADPDASMWAWGSDPHVRFWSRRQLHETAVHRADAELALGREPAIEPDVAVDGIDEFLDNLPHAAYFAPSVKELRGDGERLALECPEERWLITLEPEGFRWEHTGEPGDASVRASASELLLFTYGRRGPEQVSSEGDRDLLGRWVANASI